MSVLYPEIEPYDSGMLDVGDGHSIYWETCGNPNGKSALVLHGGPGSGCTPFWRRFFNPESYRIVLFDQRNCGRSIPHASDLRVDLSTNTTQYLVNDIEVLRQHLQIEQYLLFGGSWGSTLGLTYAEQFPHRVSECIFFGVTTTRQEEIDWLCSTIAPFFPAEWERFMNAVPKSMRAGNMVRAYYQLLNDDDPQVVIQAAQDWHDWDTISVSSNPQNRTSLNKKELDFIIARSRIVTHYFYHTVWLEEGILLQEAYKLAGIPAVLVQGRLDLQAPLKTAWELSQVWDNSELIIVDNAGHSFSDSGMGEALVVATDRFTNQ